MGVCSLNHDTTTLYNLGHTRFPEILLTTCQSRSNIINCICNSNILGAALIKKLAGSKKKRRKFHVFFSKTSVRGPKQKLGRGADTPLLSPLLADFVNSLLIGNRPPWHQSVDILTSRTQFWLHSDTGATLAHATV